MARSRLVFHRDEYDAVRACASSVFNLDARLPRPVFRDPGRATVFSGFHTILSPDFWPALRALAGSHGDDRIQLLVVEPDCDEHYVPEYGMYPAGVLTVAATGHDYWNLISEKPFGELTGAIVYSADVVAVAGASGEWGCWGERSAGLAAIQGMPDGWGFGAVPAAHGRIAADGSQAAST